MRNHYIRSQYHLMNPPCLILVLAQYNRWMGVVDLACFFFSFFFALITITNVVKFKDFANIYGEHTRNPILQVQLFLNFFFYGRDPFPVRFYFFIVSIYTTRELSIEAFDIMRQIGQQMGCVFTMLIGFLVLFSLVTRPPSHIYSLVLFQLYIPLLRCSNNKYLIGSTVPRTLLSVYCYSGYLFYVAYSNSWKI